MAKRIKKLREKGKVRFSEYFKNLREGDRVSVVRDLSSRKNFPDRIQGRAGVVEGKRGRSYAVRIKDINQPKVYIIEPIHLKKLKTL